MIIEKFDLLYLFSAFPSLIFVISSCVKSSRPKPEVEVFYRFNEYAH